MSLVGVKSRTPAARRGFNLPPLLAIEELSTMADGRVDLIRSARIRFGEAPRRFDAAVQRAVTPRRGMFSWGLSTGEKAACANFAQLIERGRVVWGHLIVAKNELFSSGHGDGRAVVVYCQELHRHDDLMRLIDVGNSLEEFRNDRSREAQDRDLRKIINDNNAWFAPRRLPEAISSDETLRISSVLVARQHVPRGALLASCVPLLAHPQIGFDRDCPAPVLAAGDDRLLDPPAVIGGGVVRIDALYPMLANC